MKKNILSLFGTLLCVNMWAQGTIMGFTVVPASPTVTDFVEVRVETQFTSGTCEVDNSAHSISGNTITAGAHHCPGMMTYICTAVDTFKLGYLSAGNKMFRFTLTSGSGGSPCTPGFIADDKDSVDFVVSQSVGIKKDLRGQNQSITIAPNPFYTATTININTDIKLENASLKIIDAQGRTVRVINDIQSPQVTLERNNLLSGIYFYQLSDKSNVLYMGKLVIE